MIFKMRLIIRITMGLSKPMDKKIMVRNIKRENYYDKTDYRDHDEGN